MPRRNGHLRFDKPGSRQGRQKGKGGKRSRDFHRSTAKGLQVLAMPELPDVGSGADPTAGTPTRVLRGGGRNVYRGEAAP